MLTTIACALAALFGLATTPATPATPATHTVAATTESGAMIRSATQHAGTVDSSNWSGYAVTPASGRITAVASTFVVPKAGLILPGFGASWTGIGGYASKDLIQAGVEEDSLPLLNVQYDAWYELLPGAEIPLTDCWFESSCAVVPGDAITVHITEIGVNEWTVFMMDAHKWLWVKNVSYTSTNSSAEWILEAPTFAGLQSPTISGVGVATFGPTSTFTMNNGQPQSIASGNPIQIDLSPYGVGVNEATPSPLDRSGQSFNDCAYAQRCAAPSA